MNITNTSLALTYIPHEAIRDEISATLAPMHSLPEIVMLSGAISLIFHRLYQISNPQEFLMVVATGFGTSTALIGHENLKRLSRTNICYKDDFENKAFEKVKYDAIKHILIGNTAEILSSAISNKYVWTKGSSFLITTALTLYEIARRNMPMQLNSADIALQASVTLLGISLSVLTHGFGKTPRPR